MTTPYTVLISCVILYVYFTVQLQYNYWTVAIYVCVQHMTGNHMTDKQPSILLSVSYVLEIFIAKRILASVIISNLNFVFVILVNLSLLLCFISKIINTKCIF